VDDDEKDRREFIRQEREDGSSYTLSRAAWLMHSHGMMNSIDTTRHPGSSPTSTSKQSPPTPPTPPPSSKLAVSGGDGKRGYVVMGRVSLAIVLEAKEHAARMTDDDVDGGDGDGD
jgi:hypothetical protein